MKNLKSNYCTLIFLTLLMIGSVSNSWSQSFEFGVRYMPTFSNLDVRSSSGGKVTVDGNFGYGIGALLGVNVSSHVGIQGEVIYSSVNQKYKEEDTDRRINLKYINIPLLITLNTGKTNAINFNVVAGPQLGLSVGSEIYSSGNGTTITPVLAVKKGDIGFAYGAGIDFGLSSSSGARLGLGYRGVTGLFDISDDSATINNDSYYVLDKAHIRTNAFYIGLSFLF